MCIPSVIQSLGERASELYKSYLDGLPSQATREQYGGRLRGFFRWLEDPQLSFAEVGTDLLQEYFLSLRPSSARGAFTALRGLVRHLIDSGLMADNEFVRNPFSFYQPITHEEASAVVKDTLRSSDEADGSFRAGYVLLMAHFYGCHDLARLSRMTGVELQIIEGYALHLKREGVWQEDGTTRQSWGLPDGEGDVAFMLDVLIAMGQVVK